MPKVMAVPMMMPSATYVMPTTMLRGRRLLSGVPCAIWSAVCAPLEMFRWCHCHGRTCWGTSTNARAAVALISTSGTVHATGALLSQGHSADAA